MNYAAIKKTDIANGTGVRVSLFVSGCNHHCKGCFNEETWDFSFGRPYTNEVTNEIIEALKPSYIAGLTLIGGEPLEPNNQIALFELVSCVKKIYPNKNIWCYTGFDFEEDILNKDGVAHCDVTDKLISMIDVLVDGKFILDKKNITLKFRGSENQRIILVKDSLKEGKTILSLLNN